VRSGYSYPTVRVYHREALSCSLGGKEPFSGTRTDERASRREIESAHRKPGHNRWVSVPNGCRIRSVRIVERMRCMELRASIWNRGVRSGYVYSGMAGHQSCQEGQRATIEYMYPREQAENQSGLTRTESA
jgi:hypothetical protein